jgi:hypothetical protein
VRGSATIDSDERRIAEELFQSVAFDFHPRDRRLELGGDVAHDVIRRFIAERDSELVPGFFDVETLGSKPRGKPGYVVVKLENETLGLLGKRATGPA